MKRFSIIALLIIISLAFSACAPATHPAPTAAPTKAPTVVPTTVPTIASTAVPTAVPTSAPTLAGLTFKDGLGREVKLAGPAKKIISLAPSNTEILFALGAATQTIGRDEFSDFPVDAKKIPSVGGSMGKYNLEEITKLQPDLILAASINTPEQIKAIENLKLTVYVVANPTDLAGLYTNLEAVGKMIGKSTEATTLVSSLKARVKAVEDAVGKTTAKPKVFYELDATEPNKPWTAGGGSFIDTLLKLAGGINTAAALKDYAQISQEELLVQNPEIILLGDAAYGTTIEKVKARAGWSAIKAVKDSQIFAFDDNLVSRPGPRLVDGLVEMAKLIHPEIASQIK